jgi:RNA polymerase sigma factor (sigma-70 family)
MTPSPTYVLPAAPNTSSDGFLHRAGSEDFDAFRNVAEGATPMSVMTLVPAPRTAPESCTEENGRGVLDALAAGDETTWSSTVRQFEGLLRSAARVVLRGDADVDEAVQRTWVLLFRNAGRINDPKCLPGWLSTTARREALAILRAQQRAVPSEDVAEHVAPDETDVATALMDGELHPALDQAVETLPRSQRLIVRALLREPESYDALSAELGIPRGSLGPLRGRAVRALRAQLEPSLR